MTQRNSAENRWRIELLGGLRAFRGNAIFCPRGRKAASLLAFLAFHRGPHARDLLSELFWPELPAPSARNNLRVTLSALRATFEAPDQSGAGLSPCLLDVSRPTVALHDFATTDVEEFEAALREASTASELAARLAAGERALELYRGTLLPGFYDDWISLEAARLEAAHLRNVRVLIGVHQTQGHAERARALTRLLERIEGPLGGFAPSRDGVELAALDEFSLETCETLPPDNAKFSSRRQTRPSREAPVFEAPVFEAPVFEAPVFEARGPVSTPQQAFSLSDSLSDSLSETFPELAPVPAPLTRFFGREGEVTTLHRWLCEENARLVTVTGMGGIGKTRLAISLALRLNQRRGEGAPGGEGAPASQRGPVCWVPLADASEAALLPHAMLAALHAPPAVSANAWDALTRALEARFTAGSKADAPPRLLMLLDNFEQLLPCETERAELSRLLERVPELQLLVTSRRILELAHEREFRLGPLPFAAAREVGSAFRGDDDTNANASGANASQGRAQPETSSSAQLFIDRARLARPDWRASPRHADEFARLLGKLEGVPLAIELVAARANVLSVGQMLARLNEDLHWLETRRSDVPLRQRSLRAALESSFRELSPAPANVLAQLTVFRGGCTLEDAEAVLNADVARLDTPLLDTSLLDTSLLDCVQELQNASLLNSEEDAHGELRLSMLEIVRQHAGELLSPSEREVVRTRHAEHFRELAERASRGGGGVPVRRALLGAEGFNFLAALEFWAARDLETALDMAASLWWLFINSEHLLEGRERLRALLQNAERPEAQTVRASRAHARAQSCACYLALLCDDADEAERLGLLALQEWRARGDESEIAAALNLLGGVEMARNRPSQARDYYAQSLALRRQQNDAGALLIALNALAGVERQSGNMGASRQLGEEALALATRQQASGAKVSSMIAWAQYNLGMLAFDAGDLAQARALQEESLAFRRANQQLPGSAACLRALAEIAWREGRREAAREQLRKALELWRRSHYRREAAQARALLQEWSEQSMQNAE